MRLGWCGAPSRASRGGPRQTDRGENLWDRVAFATRDCWQPQDATTSRSRRGIPGVILVLEAATAAATTEAEAAQQ